MRPGRRVATPLVPAWATVPESPVDYLSIPVSELYTFPKAKGLYPLKQFDQLELYWGLWTMPTNATYVELTMFGFRGFLSSTVAIALGATVPVPPSPLKYEIYDEQFLELDSTNGWEKPHQARIRETAAAATVTAGDGQQYFVGKRYSFPIEEDYIGFRIKHDGTTLTGQHTLWAILGSE